MERLILASGSPRRRALLALTGIPFTVLPADADETVGPGLSPRAAVLLLAKRKALAVAARCPRRVVLGADTVVSCGGEIFGKPRDRADACRMLRALSGRTHRVSTGVCAVLPGGAAVSFCETSEVTFRPLTRGEIEAYVATGEPMDKAGAYAIQGAGARLVRSYRGDWCGIVGLPVGRVCRLLSRLARDGKGEEEDGTC